MLAIEGAEFDDVFETGESNLELFTTKSFSYWLEIITTLIRFYRTEANRSLLAEPDGKQMCRRYPATQSLWEFVRRWLSVATTVMAARKEAGNPSGTVESM